MPSRLLAVAAAALLAVPAHAAPPRPQITDPPNDAIGAPATPDIVSGTFSTTGITTVTKVRGRKVVTYTPKKLVGTLTFAAKPLDNPPFGYALEADVAGCGELRLTYVPGTVFGQVLGYGSAWVDCGPLDPTTNSNLMLISGIDTKITGKSIVWTVSIGQFPKAVHAGVAFSEFRASVDIEDPVTGVEGTNEIGQGALDVATGSGVWKLG